MVLNIISIGLSVLEKNVLGRISGPKRDERLEG
jgi:hypothetical protein